MSTPSDTLYHPIGVIHTPWTSAENAPIQPAGARDVEGTIEIDEIYLDGLRDLDGFSHILLVYHLHQAGEARLTVTPFLDTRPHGVFATRAPRRPNPVGISVVRLKDIEGVTLSILDVDMLDGTPLLDIKPVTRVFDGIPTDRDGWLSEAQNRVSRTRSDDRFQ
jgi:tRNA-Thr(GGU) m(6)t(6)A37 methyltransferase TsaA